MENRFLVNVFNSQGKFVNFETFETNSKAIEFADSYPKFRIYKSTYYGVFEIERFGFR